MKVKLSRISVGTLADVLKKIAEFTEISYIKTERTLYCPKNKKEYKVEITSCPNKGVKVGGDKMSGEVEIVILEEKDGE